MGMTWKLKVGRVALVVLVIAALAMALSANFWDGGGDWLF
jgi:hypothetical protein